MSLATTTPQLESRSKSGIEVVNELVRAFKVRRLYDPGHPQRRESEEHSSLRMAALLEEAGPIDFVLESERLLVDGIPVHEQPEGRESIVFLLYREGVRQLSFYPGLTGEELGVFLDEVAAASLAGAEDEFDLVARLWERNFLHIHYAFVEELLDQDWVPPAQDESLVLGRDQEPIVVKEEDKNAAEFLRQVDPTLYFLDDEDMTALQREIESEKEKTLLHEALTCVLEILSVTGRTEDPAPLLAAVGDIYEALLDDEQYEQVVRLQDTLAPYMEDTPATETPAVLAAMLDRTLDPGVLRRLASRVEEGRIPEEVASSYYRAFGRNGLRMLLAHSGDLKRLCQRRLLSEAMIELARAEPAALRSAISDEDPVVASAAAFLAGIVADGVLLEPLARVLEIGDDAVRREALLAVKQIGGGRALELIARRIEDPDPTLRLYALRHLVSHRYVPALPRVRALLDQATVRSLTERRLLYEAYGALGGRGVVEDLGKRLRRREGFLRKVDPEEQACVLVALGAVGTSDARALVEEASVARHPLVQRTAIELLEEWEVDAALNS